MAANAREARRKKILERGSDRLALITGRIENRSPPRSASSHSQPTDAYADSSPGPFSVNDQAIPLVFSHPNTSVSLQDEAEGLPQLLTGKRRGSESAAERPNRTLLTQSTGLNILAGH
ncbi:uncharacterized protein LOC114712793 [Neltuma alba]|uniref:uncharacterized protein LOC114712793 n=1 Tax=Neltuma alba TaxID=207710 RepID=UPI0010A58CA8|nr:uncharacterized protein LOC114712793 [Prosopis alba]